MKSIFHIALLLTVAIQSSFAANRVGQRKPKVATVSENYDAMVLKTAYSDGEFEIGIEKGMKWWNQGKDLNHSDSLFISKYLAVMFGADEVTREKSKYFMHKMLTMDTTATVMDLYASDAIYKMFETVKTEFRLNQKPNSQSENQATALSHSNKNDSLNLSTQTPGFEASTQKNGRSVTSMSTMPASKSRAEKPFLTRSQWLWAAGGTALVGISVVAYMASSETPKSNEVLYQIDPPK
jgi:hypothetical protein